MVPINLEGQFWGSVRVIVYLLDTLQFQLIVTGVIINHIKGYINNTENGKWALTETPEMIMVAMMFLIRVEMPQS